MNTGRERTIHLRYYALLREQRGCGEEDIFTTAKTVLELYNQLKTRYNFTMSPNLLRVAINDEFKSWDTVLKINDTVVFIPPVAGG